MQKERKSGLPGSLMVVRSHIVYDKCETSDWFQPCSLLPAAHLLPPSPAPVWLNESEF